MSERLILYAEDSQMEQELFKQALKEQDFALQVKFFNDGEGIINYLKKSDQDIHTFPAPAIILLDWQMPIRSGLETLQLLKSHEEWKLIPVIIFSSHDDAEIIRSAYEAHANAYIKKPLEYDDLPRIIRAIENFWIKKVKLAFKNWDLD